MNRPLDLPRDLIDEEDCNRSGNPSFQSVLEARLSRRTLLRGGFGTAATAVLGSFGLSACGGNGDDPVSTVVDTPGGRQRRWQRLRGCTRRQQGGPPAGVAGGVGAGGPGLPSAPPAMTLFKRPS